MEYYIKINEEKRGPYSLNELAERKLDATTLVMPTDGFIAIKDLFLSFL